MVSPDLAGPVAPSFTTVRLQLFTLNIMNLVRHGSSPLSASDFRGCVKVARARLASSLAVRNPDSQNRFLLLVSSLAWAWRLGLPVDASEPEARPDGQASFLSPWRGGVGAWDGFLFGVEL